MAKQTVTNTKKKTTVKIKAKSGETGNKRCPACGKYMGGG